MYLRAGKTFGKPIFRADLQTLVKPLKKPFKKPLKILAIVYTTQSFLPPLVKIILDIIYIYFFNFFIIYIYMLKSSLFQLICNYINSKTPENNRYQLQLLVKSFTINFVHLSHHNSYNITPTHSVF